MIYINPLHDEHQHSSCIQCGAWIDRVDTNKDHVPSKALLRKPYPENLPVVVTCITCNNGFSADEEYLSLFLHCVLVGSTDPHEHRGSVARALSRHDKLRARIKRSKTESPPDDGKANIVWKPEADRVERVVVKNARGHGFYECGEPILTDPEHVWTLPLVSMTESEHEHFKAGGRIDGLVPWPEVGSRMMTRVLTGQGMRDGWVIVQDGVYRFLVAHSGAMLVRSVLFEYLATEVYWK